MPAKKKIKKQESKYIVSDNMLSKRFAFYAGMFLGIVGMNMLIVSVLALYVLGSYEVQVVHAIVSLDALLK